MRAALLVFNTLLYSQAALAESVPFQVCAESTTWTRPSPELQTNKIWNDARYKGFGKDAYAWTHDFLVLDYFMNVSLMVGVTNLSGLWTVKTQCGSPSTLEVHLPFSLAATNESDQRFERQRRRRT